MKKRAIWRFLSPAALMNRITCSILVPSLVLVTLCGNAQAVSPGSPSSIVSTALSQLDYEEGPNSYSKYGEWYGIPRGHWCDMFVSWCASQAEVPASVFPRAARCTTHVQLFRKNSPYHVSAARGGTYIPQQGDVIFFYNYPKYPRADILRHVGIVLCVENGYVFAIEGNTLTNRLDYPYYESVDPLRDDSLDPQDYAAVKCYPLDEPQIHGYAVPNYSDKTVLEHNGWVDLGKYEPLREMFDALAAHDIMSGTSSYTFSPRYGMARGDFLASVMKLYGLSGWEAETKPFHDVPENSPYYDAVMTARSAGIVCGSDSNRFSPDIYISGDEAQTIISRTLEYVGQENQLFEFSEGDFSYLLTPYTIRADIARALYALLSKMPTPAASTASPLLDGETADWTVFNVGGSNYVPLKELQQVYPQLETVSDTQGAQNPLRPTDTSNDEIIPEPQAGRPVRLPIPMEHTDRVFLSDIILQVNGACVNVPSFTYQGIRYVLLTAAAQLLNIDVKYVGGFDDVHKGDYFAQPLTWAVENKITSGTSDTAFSPNQTCTVAQILTFLSRAKGSPEPAGTADVPGVDTGAYYYKPAAWALEQGLTDSFSPDAPCTRSMVVSYLWKLAGSPAAGTSKFTDVPAGAAYAQAVAWAVEQGITSGTSDTTFSPDDTCTRGQIVSFLYRAFAK